MRAFVEKFAGVVLTLALVVAFLAVMPGGFVPARALDLPAGVDLAWEPTGAAVNVNVDSLLFQKYGDPGVVYMKWTAENPQSEYELSDIKSTFDLQFKMTFSVENGQTISGGDYFTFTFPERLIALNRVGHFKEEALRINDETFAYLTSYEKDGRLELLFVFTDAVGGHHTINGGCAMNLITIEFESQEKREITFNLNNNAVSIATTVTVTPPGDRYPAYVDGKDNGIVADRIKIGDYYCIGWGFRLNFDFGIIDNCTFVDEIPYDSRHMFITDETLKSLDISDEDIAAAKQAYPGLFKIQVLEYVDFNNDQGTQARYEEFTGRVYHGPANYMQGYEFQNGVMTQSVCPNLQAFVYGGLDGGAGLDPEIAIDPLGKKMSGSLGRVTRPVIVKYWTISTVPFSEDTLKESAVISQLTNEVWITDRDPWKNCGAAIWADNSAFIEATKGEFSFGFVKTDGENPVKGAVFGLFGDADCAGASGKSSSSGEDGKVEFTGLGAGVYYVKEISAPIGYIRGDRIYKVVVLVDGSYNITDNGTSAPVGSNTETAIIVNDRETGAVEVTKTTEGNPPDGSRTFCFTVQKSGNPDYDFAGVTAIKDGNIVDITGGEFTLAAGESIAISNLPLGYYVITEEETDDYATSAVYGTHVYEPGNSVVVWLAQADCVETVDFINAYDPDETFVSVMVEKKWDDGGDALGNRPYGVSVRLYANGAPCGAPVTLDDYGGWTYTWENLPEKADGETVVYSVSEVDVPEYYSHSVDNGVKDGEGLLKFTVTNRYTGGTVGMSVTKIWEDAFNQDGKRPGYVTVRLLENGAPSERADAVQTLDDGNNWTYAWADLPEYKGGFKVVYSVEEALDVTPLPEGYTAEAYNPADGSITNRYTPETVDIQVTKQWNDGGDVSKRPETVMVQLLKNGSPEGSPVELRADEWRYVWRDMPKYEGGEPIVYTVLEDSQVDGYLPSYMDGGPGNIVIVNTPGIGVAVRKYWDDDGDRDGIRPEAVTVCLYAVYANGSRLLCGEVVITENDGWECVWTGLPMYDDDNNRINYEAEETNVPPGYTVSYGSDRLTLVNTHEPDTMNRTVVKNWDDGGDVDGMRPGSVTVRLLADGTPYGEPVELNGGNNWAHTWYDLPKNIGGKPVVYTVNEEIVDVYEFVFDMESFVLTNRYTPRFVTKTVTKVWDDNGDAAGLRPASVTVQLYESGAAYGESVELNEGNGWSYTWNDLPSMRNGADSVYTVAELTQVPHYNTEYGAFTITNRLPSAEITLQAMKYLEGRALAPNEFLFELRQNGSVIQTKPNTAGGLITFDAITYNTEGVYLYTLTEIVLNAPRITYDPTVYEIIVTVTRNADGTLSAAQTSPTAGGTVFRNTYTPDTYTPPPVQPTVTPPPVAATQPPAATTPPPVATTQPPAVTPPVVTSPPVVAPADMTPPVYNTPAPTAPPPGFYMPATPTDSPTTPPPGFYMPSVTSVPAPPEPPVVMSETNTLVEQDDGTYIEFDENGTPLGAWTWTPDEDDAESGEWTFESFVPLGSYMPPTGENETAMWLLFAGILLVLGGICLGVKKRNA